MRQTPLSHMPDEKGTLMLPTCRAWTHAERPRHGGGTGRGGGGIAVAGGDINRSEKESCVRVST